MAKEPPTVHPIVYKKIGIHLCERYLHVNIDISVARFMLHGSGTEGEANLIPAARKRLICGHSQWNCNVKYIARISEHEHTNLLHWKT